MAAPSPPELIGQSATWLESLERVAAELAAWEAQRNARSVTTQWRFTSEDARVRLARLYPDIEP